MEPTDQDDLREALKRVAVALKGTGLPFALVGGYAVWARGGPEVTSDLDIMLRPSDAERAQEVLADAKAAFVYGHADNDGTNPPEDVARLDAMLAEHGLRARTAVYPDAPHGFTMSDTSSYQEAGAERHFTELRELFDARLGA